MTVSMQMKPMSDSTWGEERRVWVLVGVQAKRNFKGEDLNNSSPFLEASVASFLLSKLQVGEKGPRDCSYE